MFTCLATSMHLPLTNRQQWLMVSLKPHTCRSPYGKWMSVANDGVLKTHEIIAGYKFNFDPADPRHWQ